MSLQRYDLVISQAGNHMEKRADGGWVDADESQQEIDRLTAQNATMLAALRGVIEWLDGPQGPEVLFDHGVRMKRAVQTVIETTK